MGIVLGPNRYGKAENRVVRIYRDTARHEIRDLNVSTSLRGDFEDAHVTGDQSDVLPTDTQKNTAFAYAKEHGVTSPEDYAIALATRLLHATPAATGARVEVEEYAWDRIPVDGEGHDHAFVRRGGEVRTTAVDVTADATVVESGLTDLVVLKSTGSEFRGFLRDEYTTLRRGRRPGPGHLADGDLAVRRAGDHDWNARVRRHPATAARGVRDDLQPRAAGDAVRDGHRRARGATRRSPRSASPRPTSTTTSSTCRRSGSTTTARCSSPPTGPTA